MLRCKTRNDYRSLACIARNKSPAFTAGTSLCTMSAWTEQRCNGTCFKGYCMVRRSETQRLRSVQPRRQTTIVTKRRVYLQDNLSCRLQIGRCQSGDPYSQKYCCQWLVCKIGTSRSAAVFGRYHPISQPKTTRPEEYLPFASQNCVVGQRQSCPCHDTPCTCPGLFRLYHTYNTRCSASARLQCFDHSNTLWCQCMSHVNCKSLR